MGYECFTHQFLIAVVIVRGDVPFVDQETPDVIPIKRHLPKRLINRLRCRTAGKTENAFSAVCDGICDLLRKKLRRLFDEFLITRSTDFMQRHIAIVLFPHRPHHPPSTIPHHPSHPVPVASGASPSSHRYSPVPSVHCTAPNVVSEPGSLRRSCNVAPCPALPRLMSPEITSVRAPPVMVPISSVTGQFMNPSLPSEQLPIDPPVERVICQLETLIPPPIRGVSRRFRMTRTAPVFWALNRNSLMRLPIPSSSNSSLGPAFSTFSMMALAV